MPVNVPLILESPSSDPQLRLAVSQLAWMLNSLLRSGQIVMTSPADFAIAVPGVPAGIRYRFSTTTADADPGPGRLRLDQLVQNTATRIRVDDLDTYGTNYATVVAAFDDSTATVKGYITLTKEGDPSKVLAFSNGAVANPGGYQNITVTNVASSAASPFADGDYVYLSWQRAGDDGSGGVGSGTVTSVATDDTAIAALFTLTGGPITSSGTFTVSNTAQSGNKIWASPANGSSGAWVSRVAVEADLPSTTGFTDVAKTWTTAQTFPNNGLRALDAVSGFSLTLQPGSTLTSNRIFTVTTGDTNRTLNLSAADLAPTLFGASLVDDADAATARATLGLVIGTNVEAYDATLAALAAYNTNGIVCQTAADTFAGRTLTGTSNVITVTNGDGVSGDPTVTVAATYVGQTSITTVGTIGTGTWAATTIAVARGGTGQTSYTDGQLLIGNSTGNTLTKGTLTAPAAGITITGGGGTVTFALANDLAALEGMASTGLVARTASETYAQRTLTATAGQTAVTNGDGVSGNPTVALAAIADLRVLANVSGGSAAAAANTLSAVIDACCGSPADGDILVRQSGAWSKKTPSDVTVVTGISSISMSGVTVNCDGTVSGSASATVTTGTAKNW